MIIDGRQTDGLPTTEYDLVIIGAGPAGITLVHELKGSGLRIALLESGGEDYDDAAQALNAGTIEGNDDEYELEFSRLRFLGGTSNHWGGICTPLDAVDFERSWNGFSGWPMSRASLDPFYERAHPYCDLGAYNYAYETLVPDAEARALLSEAPEIETAVLRQSTPTRFGEKYADVLAASETVHLWLWTTAVRVSTGQAAEKEVVTRSLDGPDRQFSARAVVLAAGAIETTRLLMWSNAQNGTSAGDSGGLLGKCYMDHPSGGAAFLHFADRQADKVYWSDIDRFADNGTPLHFVWRLSDAHLAETGLPNAHFYVFGFADSDEEVRLRNRGARAVSSLKSVVKWAIGRDVDPRFDPATAYCDAVSGADAFVITQADKIFNGEGFSRALLKYEAEQTPDRENGMRLDVGETDATGLPRPVLTWSPSDDDMEAVRRQTMEIGRLAGAAGLGRMELEGHDINDYWGTTTAWHQLGMLRMAESPTSGVVDADCRVHGTDGLYVAGGGVFPQSGRANPTLTIVALAIRLADHLNERLA